MIAVRHRLFVDDIGAGISQIGADRRPAGRPRPRNTSASTSNQGPWHIAATGFPCSANARTRSTACLVGAQLVRVAHPAGQDQRIKILGARLLDGHVGPDRLARIVVHGRLDRASGPATQASPSAPRSERISRGPNSSDSSKPSVATISTFASDISASRLSFRACRNPPARPQRLIAADERREAERRPAEAQQRQRARLHAQEAWPLLGLFRREGQARHRPRRRSTG